LLNHLSRRAAGNNSQVTPPPGRNLILRALSDEDLNSLKPHMEFLAMPERFVIYDESAPIEFVYFLNSGIGSLVSQFVDGGSVETGIGGLEGFWGGSLLAGVVMPPGQAFMQVAGDGFRVSKDVFMDCVRSSRAFEDLLHRALYLEHVQARQIAACNIRHEVVERLARWLLMCDDRVQSDRLALTHEFLAVMLGTRRSSVTLAAGSLQEAGLIRYTRRAIEIVNRAELEQASCSCYGMIAIEYERVIGLEPYRHDGQPKTR
jgi:CRP-like cAMP-binding protein